METVSTDSEPQRVSYSARHYYSNELIDHLLNEINEYAIFMIDKLGIIVTWNPGVQRLLGYSEKEFIGQPFALIFDKEDQTNKVNEKELELARITGRAEDQRWHRRKNGSYFWANGLVTSTKNSDEELTGFVKIMRDQTALKEMEIQLSEYAKKLSVTNQQLLKFAGVVSHDLSAPLQSVKGFASIVQEKISGSDKEVEQSMTQIVDSADRMLNLVKELMKFSKESDGNIIIEPVDSEKVLLEVLDNLNANIKQSQGSVNHSPLPVVQASVVQLNRIFQNLIENALKFRNQDVPARIDISASNVGKNIEFRICDNGIGMDENQQKRLFTLFERLEPKLNASGFGIGLATTKHIVELLGGQLSVQSKRGEGSTFIFTLPGI